MQKLLTLLRTMFRRTASSQPAPVKKQRRARLVVECLESRLVPSNLPPGFQEIPVASGLDVVAATFAPDGRLFVAEKAGRVRIIQNDSLLATPFLTLQVDTFSERGLDGIALDPHFSQNGFVYLYYTTADPANPNMPGNAARNRLSRFKASSANPNLADGTELILIDGISAVNGNHNGGSLQFGADGKLYVGVGDAGVTANSQDLSKLNGKILRVDPSNPSSPAAADNPFYNAGNGISAIDFVWAYGFRNPFTSAMMPGTNTLFVNDVGGNRFEEVNVVLPGRNYGWPIVPEGPSTNPAFTNPIYSYPHGSGAAITGGAFYTGNNFPAQYQGRYFFGDYVQRFIRVLDPQANNQVSDFGTDLPGPADFDVGPDGSLYYLSLFDQAVYKIRYVGPPPAHIYVDDTFDNPVAGQDPDGAGPATNFGTDSFATIQQGINAVAVGGTVHVAAGNYVQNLLVNKSLILLGEAAATTNLSGAGTGLNVSGAIVTIANLAVRNFTTGISANGNTALSLTDVHLINNTIGGNINGVTIVNLTGSDAGDSLNISSTQVSRTAENPVNYGGVGTLNIIGRGGADTIKVTSTAAGTSLNVHAGNGNDSVQVNAATQLGAVLQGPVFNIDVGAGDNQLIVDESANANGDIVTVRKTAILGEGPLPFDIDFIATGGTFNNGILLFTGTKDDWVRVRGSAGILALTTGPGSDAIDVTAETTQLGDVLTGALNIDAGPGSNLLNVSQPASTNGDIISIAASTIRGDGPLPFLIGFSAAGATFSSVNLSTGLSDDWIRVFAAKDGPLNVSTGAGHDFIEVIAETTQLGDSLKHFVTFDAGTGGNTLAVREVASTNGDIVTAFANQLRGDGPLPFTINYFASGGSFGGGVSLTTGMSDDWIRIVSKRQDSPLNINSGPGNDVVDILVNSSSGYTSFLVNGAAGGSDKLRIDPGGGSRVNNMTGPGMGSVIVTFGGGMTSTIDYQGVESVS